MNFRDLEYVLQVSKTLNFTEAAKIFNVSQPSLSYQIKKLETELGADIFLSSFDEFFVENAEKIVSIQNRIMNEAGVSALTIVVIMSTCMFRPCKLLELEKWKLDSV